MSEQEKGPDTVGSFYGFGDQESRFLPGARLEARDITATNVATVQYIHLPDQQYIPPLQLPRRAEHFQDRVSERSWLLAHLQPGQIVTICGPGGMGKTALVAEVLWTLAPGDSPPALFPHGLVFHSFYGQPETTVALEQLARTFGEDPLPTPKQAAQRALGGKCALLVLDGAEEAENLEQVLSVCASCAVLVTSRRRSDAADPALLLDLQRLPSEEAVAVVQAWRAQRQVDIPVIERIVQLVGGLPLALRLIGSYLALHQEEAVGYLAWLEEDPLKALDQGKTTHRSVPILLERSLARLSPDVQAALRVIRMLALAPFERDLVAGVLELAPRVASRVLDELVDYGLLVQIKASYEVSHPLIHTYLRQVLLAGHGGMHQHALVERLVLVLAGHFPEVAQENWPRCERLVPHIRACALLIEQYQVLQKEAGTLLNQTGWYLYQRGKYEQAEPLLQQALRIREQMLGTDHPDTATSLNNLGSLYQDRGKYEQADPLLQRALRIREQTLNPDHPDIAISLNNLARLYLDQGKYEEAELLLKRALTVRERVFGADHPDTAISLNNLGSLYHRQGKYEQAEPLFQRGLVIREQMLGTNHPNTATSLNSLARLYLDQGKYEEAEPLLKRALAICEQQLGANHPTTRIVRQNYTSLLEDFSPRNEQH